ncbi:DUF1129 domain-containing protein, partial [Lactobacillus nasalidis]
MSEEKQVKNASQAKLQKQGEAEAKSESIKQADPKELRSKLSNKNRDYIYRLKKELLAGGLSEADADAKIDGLLPEIYDAQIKGQPAHVLFGAAPKLKASQILNPVVKPEKVPDKLVALDGALFYTAMLTALFGILQLFTSNNKSTSSGSGILTLIIMGLAMGWYFTKYNSWMQPDPKTGKPAWGKVIWGLIGSLAIIMLIVFVLSLPALSVINPVLPGWADLLVAAAAYGIRWLVRRHYGIEGTSL